MICYKKSNQILILCSFWYIINMGDPGMVGIFKDDREHLTYAISINTDGAEK